MTSEIVQRRLLSATSLSLDQAREERRASIEQSRISLHWEQIVSGRDCRGASGEMDWCYLEGTAKVIDKERSVSMSLSFSCLPWELGAPYLKWARHLCSPGHFENVARNNPSSELYARPFCFSFVEKENPDRMNSRCVERRKKGGDWANALWGLPSFLSLKCLQQRMMMNALSAYTGKKKQDVARTHGNTVINQMEQGFALSSLFFRKKLSPTIFISNYFGPVI